jgi:hypothetical protein
MDGLARDESGGAQGWWAAMIMTGGKVRVKMPHDSSAKRRRPDASLDWWGRQWECARTMPADIVRIFRADFREILACG